MASGQRTRDTGDDDQLFLSRLCCSEQSQRRKLRSITGNIKQVFFGGEVGALLKGTGYLDSTSTTIKEHVKLNKSVFLTESASFWFVGFLLFEVRT